MRYGDWDIILFPSDSGRDTRVPIKEFRVACHVVPDVELANNPGSFGLPVMTCFIPGLPHGSPFYISVHSWKAPEISQFTANYSKHSDLVKFEARVLIDGRLVSSTSFERLGQWPHLINSTFEMNKQGELEPLKFPLFRREILYENHWSPGEDIGRIKVAISEGFPRDSLSVPIERVKNVVVFSFQHAPLEILENNGIAWPNPQMWHRPLCDPSMPVPTFHPEDGADSHSHSPRRRSLFNRVSASQGVPMPFLSSLATSQAGPYNSGVYPSPMPLLHRSALPAGSVFPDPFTETAYLEWVNSLGLSQGMDVGEFRGALPTHFPRQPSKQSSTDTSMPDYMSSYSGPNVMPESMHMSGTSIEDETQVGSLKVPTNTPTAGPHETVPGFESFTFNIPNPAISGELATSLTTSLLNQPQPLPVPPHQIPLPASEIKGRKENRHLSAPSTRSPVSRSSTPGEAQARKLSHAHATFVVAGEEKDRAESTSIGPAFGRNASLGEFGANITNMADPSQGSRARLAPGTGNEKGNKRGRNFTPASTKAIDEEDEPRRLSPHVRAAAASKHDGSQNDK